MVPVWVRRGAEQSVYCHRRKLVSGKTALGNIDQHCRDWAVKLLIPQPNGLLTTDSRSIGTNFGFFREPMQNAELVPGSQVFQLPAVRRGCARLSRTKPARTAAPRASPAFLYFGSWIHFFCRSVISYTRPRLTTITETISRGRAPARSRGVFSAFFTKTHTVTTRQPDGRHILRPRNPAATLQAHFP